jgi:NADH-quinone oxidoreductase subunit A
MLASMAVIMVVGALIVGKLVRPHNPTELKLQAYECGEDPVGNAWANFNVRFYVTALIFIIFDVESALMFPVAAVFKQFVMAGSGAVVFLSLFLFVSVLIQGVIYCWSKGDLEWVKSFRKNITKN